MDKNVEHADQQIKKRYALLKNQVSLLSSEKVTSWTECREFDDDATVEAMICVLSYALKTKSDRYLVFPSHLLSFLVYILAALEKKERETCKGHIVDFLLWRCTLFTTEQVSIHTLILGIFRNMIHTLITPHDFITKQRWGMKAISKLFWYLQFYLEHMSLEKLNKTPSRRTRKEDDVCVWSRLSPEKQEYCVKCYIETDDVLLCAARNVVNAVANRQFLSTIFLHRYLYPAIPQHAVAREQEDMNMMMESLQLQSIRMLRDSVYMHHLIGQMAEFFFNTALLLYPQEGPHEHKSKKHVSKQFFQGLTDSIRALHILFSFTKSVLLAIPEQFHLMVLLRSHATAAERVTFYVMFLIDHIRKDLILLKRYQTYFETLPSVELHVSWRENYDSTLQKLLEKINEVLFASPEQNTHNDILIMYKQEVKKNTCVSLSTPAALFKSMFEEVLRYAFYFYLSSVTFQNHDTCWTTPNNRNYFATQSLKILYGSCNETNFDACREYLQGVTMATFKTKKRDSAIQLFDIVPEISSFFQYWLFMTDSFSSFQQYRSVDRKTHAVKHPCFPRCCYKSWVEHGGQKKGFFEKCIIPLQNDILQYLSVLSSCCLHDSHCKGYLLRLFSRKREGTPRLSLAEHCLQNDNITVVYPPKFLKLLIKIATVY